MAFVVAHDPATEVVRPAAVGHPVRSMTAAVAACGRNADAFRSYIALDRP
jgi:hypothetical protein